MLKKAYILTNKSLFKKAIPFKKNNIKVDNHFNVIKAKRKKAKRWFKLKPIKKFPLNIKHKDKQFKQKLRFNKPYPIGNTLLRTGEFGFKTLTNVRIKYREAETLRDWLNHKCKLFKPISFWIRFTFDTPLKTKGLGSRMGKGKGKTLKWVSQVKKGSILMEFYGFLKYRKLKKFPRRKRVLMDRLPRLIKFIRARWGVKLHTVKRFNNDSIIFNNKFKTNIKFNLYQQQNVFVNQER